MAYLQMLAAALNFLIGRATHFVVGATVSIAGVRHILNPADSLLGGFLGLPDLVAFIIGFSVLFVGLLYLAAAISPMKWMK
jgi:hypothetical protein